MRVVMCAVLVATVSVASADRLRDRTGQVKDVPSGSVEFALREGYTKIPQVDMRSPEGVHVLIDEDQVPEAMARGFWKMSSEEAAAETEKRIARVSAEIDEDKSRGAALMICGALVLVAALAAVTMKLTKKTRHED